MKEKSPTELGNSVVTAVENLVHGVILTGMDNVNIRVEMALRSISGSSGREANSVVHNPHQRNFLRNMENTPLMTACGRVDLNIDDDKNDETLDVENFRPLGPNGDRQSHIHPSFLERNT